jgi:hypothetical protein
MDIILLITALPAPRLTPCQITLNQAHEHIALARQFDKMGLRELGLEMLEEARMMIALAQAGE